MASREAVIWPPDIAPYSNRESIRHLPKRALDGLGDTVVYTPQFKTRLIVGGGIGSVRLKPRTIDCGTVWFMSASSTGVAHEGFPVAVPDSIHADFIDQFGTVGPFACSLTGILRFLPTDFDPLFYSYVHVPQVYLLVDRLIREADADTTNQLLASGVITFETDFDVGNDFVRVGGSFEDYQSSHAESGDLEAEALLHAGFVSFDPFDAHSIEDAAVWLENAYVRELLAGRVVSDFDEQMHRFRDAPFSLHKVMNLDLEKQRTRDLVGRLSPQSVNLFVTRIEELRIRKVEQMHEQRLITIGDNATINAPITIADTIEESFNVIQQSPIDENIKELLEELTQAVVVSANAAPPEVAQAMARDVETLAKEVTSENPRRSWWELSLASLREAATTLGQVATPILDITARLSTLL